jgi:DNA-directed RNA polymerase subunit omega
MARVTIEDCLKNVKNRFELVHVAASRVRQLSRGSVPLVECDNKNVVTSLREIAANLVSVRLVTQQELDEDNIKVDLPEFVPQQQEI